MPFYCYTIFAQKNHFFNIKIPFFQFNNLFSDQKISLVKSYILIIPQGNLFVKSCSIVIENKLK